jgi:regulatory protein
MLVRARHGERGLTGPALANELRRRGVDDETAAEAMTAIGPQDETARAEALAAKKLASTWGLDREVRLRRTVAMLARKGYSMDLAISVTNRLMSTE